MGRFPTCPLPLTEGLKMPRTRRVEWAGQETRPQRRARIACSRLSAPPPGDPARHDGSISTDAPNVMWGTDGITGGGSGNWGMSVPGSKWIAEYQPL